MICTIKHYIIIWQIGSFTNVSVPLKNDYFIAMHINIDPANILFHFIGPDVYLGAGFKLAWNRYCLVLFDTTKCTSFHQLLFATEAVSLRYRLREFLLILPFVTSGWHKKKTVMPIRLYKKLGTAEDRQIWSSAVELGISEANGGRH